MYLKGIGFCFVGVFGMNAMEGENKKKTLKPQPNPIAKSPQLQKVRKIKTAEDIPTDPKSQDAFRISLDQDEFRNVKGKRRSISIDNGQLAAMVAITEVLFIKEEKQGALKKQKSDEDIKEIIKDTASINING